MYLVTKKYKLEKQTRRSEYHKILLAFKDHTKEIRGCFAFDIFEKIQPSHTLLFITYWQGIEYYRSYWERVDTKKLREHLSTLTDEEPEITQTVLRQMYLPESQRWHRLYNQNQQRKSHHPGLLYQQSSHQRLLNEYRPYSNSAVEFAHHHPYTQVKSQSQNVSVP